MRERYSRKRSWYRRQTIGGYTDIGRIQIPPLPQNIIMTDRSTLTQYFLTHTGNPGSLVLFLSSSIPVATDKTIFGPTDGPYVTGDVKLFISSGTLQAEPIDPGTITAYNNQRVLTRRGIEHTFLQISVAEDWEPGDGFIFTEITV